MASRNETYTDFVFFSHLANPGKVDLTREYTGKWEDEVEESPATSVTHTPSVAASSSSTMSSPAPSGFGMHTGPNVMKQPPQELMTPDESPSRNSMPPGPVAAAPAGGDDPREARAMLSEIRELCRVLHEPFPTELERVGCSMDDISWELHRLQLLHRSSAGVNMVKDMSSLALDTLEGVLHKSRASKHIEWTGFSQHMQNTLSENEQLLRQCYRLYWRSSYTSPAKQLGMALAMSSGQFLMQGWRARRTGAPAASGAGGAGGAGGASTGGRHQRQGPGAGVRHAGPPPMPRPTGTSFNLQSSAPVMAPPSEAHSTFSAADFGPDSDEEDVQSSVSHNFPRGASRGPGAPPLGMADRLSSVAEEDDGVTLDDMFD